ncbi:MAG: DHA2 family efflux MFS transporter permease subunit [Chitinophagaceae bacterium]
MSTKNNTTACLVVLLLGTSMVPIDSSLVNVSLPVIRRLYSSDITTVQWVITAYMLAFSIFIPLTDWLKNRIGFYNLFVGSIFVFTIGTFLCGIAGNLEWLLAARMFQAIGSGAILPTALAIKSTFFRNSVRNRTMGIWGMIVVLGPAISTIAGGILTQYFGWHIIFFVNIPIGIITLLLSFRYLAFLKEGPPNKEPFHLTGFLSLSLFIIALQYSLIKIQSLSFHSAYAPVLLFVLVASAFIFYYSSKKNPYPLLDLSLFRYPQFGIALLLTGIRSIALYGGLFLLPFLLQVSLGFSETATSLLLLPNAIILGSLLQVTSAWTGKHGYRNISIAGLILLAISMFLFGGLTKGSTMLAILFAMVIRGTGLSMVNSPITSSVIRSVPQEKAAMASAINTLVIQVSGALGVSASSLCHQFFTMKYHTEGLTVAMAEHRALFKCFMLAGFLLFVAILPALKLPEKKNAVPGQQNDIDPVASEH